MQVIPEKYKKTAVKYYYNRLQAVIRNKEFTKLPPSKDWNETFERTQTKIQATSRTVEKKLVDFGNRVDEKFE